MEQVAKESARRNSGSWRLGQIRALGHRMLEDMLTYLQNIRSIPSGSPLPKAIDEICAPLTPNGEGEEKVYKIFQKSILPCTLAHTRPRFWG